MSLIKATEVEENESYAMHHFPRIIEEKTISDFNLIRFIVKPNQESVEDQHKVKEKWYIAKGEGLLVINQTEKIIAKEGDLFFFDSMTTHKIYNPSPTDNLEILSIWW
jgi:mannose-6-phosphate isomerase-like protein (cupin superfamily)